MLPRSASPSAPSSFLMLWKRMRLGCMHLERHQLATIPVDGARIASGRRTERLEIFQLLRVVRMRRQRIR
jgi:hypothetical protein